CDTRAASGVTAPMGDLRTTSVRSLVNRGVQPLHWCASMRARLLAATVGALLLPAAPAVAGDPIMPLSQVRSGMQCTGYSVIRGTEISSFDVEIIDVIDGDASGEGPRLLVRVSGPA